MYVLFAIEIDRRCRRWTFLCCTVRSAKVGDQTQNKDKRETLGELVNFKGLIAVSASDCSQRKTSIICFLFSTREKKTFFVEVGQSGYIVTRQYTIDRANTPGYFSFI